MRWLLVLVVVAGCNEVYGLDRTKPRDASTLVVDDVDGDGVVDPQDNCPQLANADQGDTDGDGRGDLCDDCPLIGNEQGLDTDLDGIGDVCDPHPSSAGDCLLELDTFRDPSVFFAHWKATPGLVVPEAGLVRLRPTVNASPIEVTSLTAADATDVMLQGTAPPPPNAADPHPIVTAFAAREASGRFYGCRLIAPQDLEAGGPGVNLPITKPLVPKTPVNDKFVVRLITKHEVDIVDVTCRVDYGVAVGTDSKPAQPTITGPAGFSGSVAESTLDAVAMFRFQPGATCPPTSYR